MADDAPIARRLRVTGRVQGVWYRGWIRAQAAELGLDGWVRNRQDGAVEMVVAGKPAAVALLTQRAWQGPPQAAVTEIEDNAWSEPVAPGFVQLPTV